MKAIFIHGRFDIVLWKEDFPWGIVEVKKNIETEKNYKEDVVRFNALLKTIRGFEEKRTLNCFFLFYLEREDDHHKKKKAEQKILNYLSHMKENVKSTLDDKISFKVTKGEPVRYKKELKKWAHQSFCFVIHD